LGSIIIASTVGSISNFDNFNAKYQKYQNDDQAYAVDDGLDVNNDSGTSLKDQKLCQNLIVHRKNTPIFAATSSFISHQHWKIHKILW